MPLSLRLAALALLLPFAAAAQTTLLSPNSAEFGSFGWDVSGVPDVDGDGVGDLIIGAPGEDVGGGKEGRVYIFSGASGEVLRTLVSTRVNGFGFGFGFSVVGLGDIDGDGFGDVAVGAPRESVGAIEFAGRVYVFSGATGALIRTHTHTAPYEPAGFGQDLAAVPDTDGDGIDDLLVGSQGWDDNAGTFNRGLAHLYSGASGTLLRAVGHPTNSATRTGFAEHVAGVPDANGDGRGDLLIGAPGDAANESGRAFLINGATGALLRTLANPANVEDGYFGSAVAGLPDVTGDGRGDLAVTGAQDDSRVRVFNGATGALLYSVDSPVAGTSPGFSIGVVLAGAPDADGDGKGELLIGAQLAPEGGSATSGRVYLVNGTTGAIRSTFTSPNPEPFGSFGLSVSAVPGLVGGYLIGAVNEDPGGANRAGRAYVLGTPGQTIVNVTTDESNPAASTTEGLCDVDRAEDGQQCTLRAAIDLARAGRTTSISFDLPSSGRTIAVGSELPAIPGGTELGKVPVTGGPPVRIDGGGGSYHGLIAAGEGVEIKGVAVTGFGGTAIRLEGEGGHTVEGCYVGLDPDGTTAAGNAVGIEVFVPGVTVENCVVAGNAGGGTGVGIAVRGAGATGATVVGNRVGLSADGMMGVPNDFGIVIDGAPGAVVDSNRVAGGGVGILVAAVGDDSPVPTGTRLIGNVLGLLTDGTLATATPSGTGIRIGQAAGTQVGEATATPGDKPGNVVSGWVTGIEIAGGDGGPAVGTTVAGNLIGLDPTGLMERPNDVGVRVRDGVETTTVGGAGTEQRNVITANTLANVWISHDAPRPADPTVVTGNWIGLDAAGASDLTLAGLADATRVGVRVDGAAHATVGPANVIGGHIVGVWADAPETVVFGNRIGTDPDGLAERANYVGVAATASRVAVGRDGAAPNVISGNDLEGSPSDDDTAGVGVWVVDRAAIEALTSSGAVLRSLRAAEPASSGRWSGAAVQDVAVSGNWVGVTVGGDAAVIAPPDVSGTIGIWVANGAERTQVFRNVVGGQNVGIGLLPTGTELSGAPGPADTRVADNRIGLGAAGDAAVPNRLFGVYVGGSTGAVIGEGAIEGRGPNRITATGDADFVPPSSPIEGAPGVFLLHPDDADGLPTGTNTLTRNLIWDNGGLGISRDLSRLGITPNGAGNTDGVASFDTPVLLAASGGSATLTVRGTTSAPQAVEVFASERCDKSGYGEGQRYLGTVQSEGGVFDGVVDGVPFPSWRVTTTGTNLNGTTSEFSPCVTSSVTGDASTLPVASGQTPSLDGPDIDVAVTANAAALSPEISRRADGTLFVALHRTVAEDGPADGAFEGSATSDDGTTVTPDDIQRQRFWSVQSDGLDGITYEACLHIDDLFSLPVPEQLVVVTRAGRGSVWTPHATTLRGAGAERAICAGGLTGFGELAIGADGTVNPVPGDEGPDALPTAFMVSAYPNPSRGHATVSVEMPTAGAVTAEVLDALGRRVARLWDGPLAAGTHSLRLDAALAPGLYVVRVAGPGGVAARRLTVVR